MRIQPIFSTPPHPPSKTTDLALAFLAPSRRPSFRRLVETAAETLWAILLFLVIGFFLWKVPAISSAFDDAANAFHRGGEPVVRADDTQIQDLELRMDVGERKLRALEHGYAQLKQRHADLLRAYAEVLAAPRPPAAEPATVAALRARK